MGNASAEESGQLTIVDLQELRHKISTPLTSILLQCDLLLGDDRTSQDTQRLETIIAEALRIDRFLRFPSGESSIHD